MLFSFRIEVFSLQYFDPSYVFSGVKTPAVQDRRPCAVAGVALKERLVGCGCWLTTVRRCRRRGGRCCRLVSSPARRWPARSIDFVWFASLEEANSSADSRRCLRMSCREPRRCTSDLSDEPTTLSPIDNFIYRDPCGRSMSVYSDNEIASLFTCYALFTRSVQQIISSADKKNVHQHSANMSANKLTFCNVGPIGLPT